MMDFPVGQYYSIIITTLKCRFKVQGDVVLNSFLSQVFFIVAVDVSPGGAAASSLVNAGGKPATKLNKQISYELLEIKQPQHLSNKCIYHDYFEMGNLESDLHRST